MILRNDAPRWTVYHWASILVSPDHTERDFAIVVDVVAPNAKGKAAQNGHVHVEDIFVFSWCMARNHDFSSTIGPLRGKCAVVPLLGRRTDPRAVPDSESQYHNKCNVYMFGKNSPLGTWVSTHIRIRL